MISSVVVRFTRIDSLSRTIDQLQGHPAVDVGELQRQCVLPATVEARDGEELEQTHNWIRELPGVVSVDVVFVSFQENLTEGAHQEETTDVE